MTIMTLYTGGGVSLSPRPGPGRHESDYVRLVADEGMAITDGEIITYAADVRREDVELWSDCHAPVEDEEATTADLEAALEEVGV